MATGASVIPSAATVMPSAKDASDRLGREQTSRSAQELEREWDGNDWVNQQFTSAPPPLEGFEQRWVRVRASGQDDIQNYLKRMKQGWKPRPADTLPKAYESLRQRLKKDVYGDQGDVIGNQDCVLMHRPVRVGDLVRAKLREQTTRLSASIRDFVRGNLPRQPGTVGGSVEELNIRTSNRPARFAGD